MLVYVKKAWYRTCMYNLVNFFYIVTYSVTICPFEGQGDAFLPLNAANRINRSQLECPTAESWFSILQGAIKEMQNNPMNRALSCLILSLLPPDDLKDCKTKDPDIVSISESFGGR